MEFEIDTELRSQPGKDMNGALCDTPAWARQWRGARDKRREQTALLIPEEEFG